MNQTEYKIRNLESQILYLQEEHARTLKLLHLEIKDLQMKNSETSFALLMANISASDSEIKKDHHDNKLLLGQISQLKDEVHSLTSQVKSKVIQCNSYEGKIYRLNETISSMRLSYKKEVESLEIELNNKCSDIVQLSTKLLNLRKLPQSDNVPESSADNQFISAPLVLQSPISPKLFKFRNQVSVHPDNIHSRHRSVIARQTMLSTSLPIKSKTPSPSFPEYAISVEDRSVFSKSIKRPSILPPINPTKNRNFSDSRHGLNISKQDFGTDPCLVDNGYNREMVNSKKKLEKTTKINRLSIDPRTSHVEVDRLLDMNNSSIILPSKPINCNFTKNRST